MILVCRDTKHQPNKTTTKYIPCQTLNFTGGGGIITVKKIKGMGWFLTA